MKVVDVNGDQLHIGDRVEHLFNVNGWVTAGKTGEVVGFNFKRQEACVAFTGPVARFELHRPLLAPRTFVASDLVLCPEGSE